VRELKEEEDITWLPIEAKPQQGAILTNSIFQARGCFWRKM